MNSKEKIIKIFDRKGSGDFGFWTGNPHEETWEMYLRQLNFQKQEELFNYLEDDCRWCWAESAYKHPDGNPMFDQYSGRSKKGHGDIGCFAETDSLQEIEKYPWPNPDYLDFSQVVKINSGNSEKAVLSGM